MALLTWIGFIISTILLVLIARKSLWIAISTASIILGLFTIAPVEVVQLFLNALLHLPNVLLATGMAFIPVLGTMMEESGQINSLVKGLRINKAIITGMAPSLIGLLPVPGGALISAPIVKQTAHELSDSKKCGVNVWCRHLLFLVYPASTGLIITTTLANLDIYIAILYLLPSFSLSVILAYLYYLRPIKGKIVNGQGESVKREEAMKGFLIIIATPIVDLIFRLLYGLMRFGVENLSLVLGVATSLFLSLYWGKFSASKMPKIIKKAKPWNLFLFMISIFFYLNIFLASGLSELVVSYNLHPTILLVFFGFGLGYITGRTQVPLTILIPIYMGTYGLASMSPLAYSVAMFATHIGYLLSPIHPCLSVTLDYFGTTYGKTFKAMLVPASISLLLPLLLSFFI